MLFARQLKTPRSGAGLHHGICSRGFKGTRSLEKNAPDQSHRWWSYGGATGYFTHQASSFSPQGSRIFSACATKLGRVCRRIWARQQNFTKKRPIKDTLSRRIISACATQPGRACRRIRERQESCSKKRP